MPIGTARSGLLLPGTPPGPPPFDTFNLIAAVTPTTDSSNSTGLISGNALDWETGDLLLAFASGVHGSTTRNGSTPSPLSWTPGTEAWAQRFNQRGFISPSAALSFNGYTATALSSETAKTATLGFSGTMFNLQAALFRCRRATIIRQVTPVAIIEDATTSITATFGAAVLETSQIVSFVSQRATTAFGVPSSFTEIFAQNVSTNHRAVVAARIGHSGTTVATTGLSSAAAAKLAVAIELARPGDEL